MIPSYQDLCRLSRIFVEHSNYAYDPQDMRIHEWLNRAIAVGVRPKWVKQEDVNGCVVAAIAMIVNKSYAEVKSELHPKNLSTGAYTSFEAESYLYEHGYRLVKKWKHVCFSSTDREQWPIEPFAPIHYVSIRNGDKAHAVVMLADGSVLDPFADSAPRKITDYEEVCEIIGVWEQSI